MCVRLSLEKIANSYRQFKLGSEVELHRKLLLGASDANHTNRFQMCGWRKWQREKLAKIDGENGSEETS
jgi:hypothetical protein